ncbi:hypothetical protein RND81_01G051200 [Saponaria officinalis]|uniref:Uncharacterized protein n=1 Tax=Saponaria officinalis TaxID=3572 RepID=A0AAW1NGH5_SAPOF
MVVQSSLIVAVHPLSSYSFGTKEPKLEKNTFVADRLARMRLNTKITQMMRSRKEHFVSIIWKELIQYLKYTCPAHLYGTSISPPAAQQIISAIKVLLGEDGSSRGAQKLARIR